jgi:acetyltransferase-like isoleucine patch superfamily enzyme
LRLSETGLTVLRDGEFNDLGLLPNIPGTLGFLKDHRLLSKVGGPVITEYKGHQSYPSYDLGEVWADRYLSELEMISTIPYPLGAVVATQPEDEFWALHERLVAQGFYPQRKNYIGQDTQIHPRASIGEWNVGLHRGHGYVTNAGYVHIGDRVTIGAHTAVDRSVWKKPTFIDDDTHIDNLVHIAHNVWIGKNCLIIAGTVIGGSAVIEDDVFIGIGARIRPGVRIGRGAFIGMSVTVLRDVAPGERLVVSSDR